MLRAYYQLAKPGIIRGNILSATAGFLLAAQGHINFATLLATLVGLALIIGAACVVNNCYDRDIDTHMARTNKRSLVTGEISLASALWYAIILLILGIAILATWTNIVTLLVGLAGFIAYVVIYTPAKRLTVHSTLLGSISGAMPIVGGYTAVTGSLDMAAFLLFAIMTVWQMPHFYGIALYRLKDYTTAKLPVLPVVKGAAHTRLQIIGYIMLFILACAGLTIFGYAGYSYLIIMLVLGAAWLRLALRPIASIPDGSQKWGKQVFLFSLISLTTFCILVSVTTYLP
ncbi:MAG: heme synthase [Candidatus Saccharibacteria bacterium]|nr:heme synthase [Candidatus Saccharibacteria bacterium]